MTGTQKIPNNIFGILLAKSIPVGSLDILHMTQVQICGRNGLYNVLRFRDIFDVDEAIPDYGVIARGLDIKSAIACAIKAENESLANKWRNFDRWPAQDRDGLETIARQVGIERLLVGMDTVRHGWVYTPRTYQDWQGRAEKHGLRVVRPELS